MEQRTIFLTAGAAVLCLLLGLYFWHTGRQNAGTEEGTLKFVPAVAQTQASTTPVAFPKTSEVTPQRTRALTTTPGVERWYTNTALKFSFRLPDGFSAPDGDTGTPGVYAVAVYNPEGDALVVMAYPISQGTAITESVLRANLPNEHITDVREGVIGTAVRGLYFRSDDPDWGGDAIGFWAAYNGYLYELRTFRHEQALMDFVIANWFFAPPTPSVPQKK